MSNITSQFKFNGFEVLDISYSLNRDYRSENKDYEITPHFNIRIGQNIEHDNIRVVFLECSITSNEKKPIPMDITVAIEGQFDISEIDETEKIDRFLKYNGVAILMPYLRAQIAQVIALTGKNPINLPLININKLYIGAEEE